MSDAFSVDPDSLAEAVARMSEFVRHTACVVGEIDSLVSHLHGTWSGQAAEAHAEAHRHWSRGEAMMREALAQLKTAGTTAHHNYTGAMTTNTTMWS
ncbi:WXG100 family type VII secretion target [Mycobacterium sp.]|uniref:WXG100 family type VII secretion target n=1 Tax=Mycobacterium sp. TaxID=1785 RepID=UPI003C74D279